ncbi:MAG: hypothetical protein KDC59_10470 [Saprospiraceae bacterium]|nr:hypothetical protein [Saprospiraceae bacterium]
MKNRVHLACLLLLLTPFVYGQRQDNNLSRDLTWRNIGPANMMGRIAAIDALQTDYRHVVVASASGGVFLSTNAGWTWDAIFDRYGAGSIGSVSLCQEHPEIIWVGTGESANRNSSGWGDGIYKSTDNGKTFQHMGLKTTNHIKTIAIHPKNPDIVYAAAEGHLWGYSGDRGLFKTTDGGKSWTKLTNGLPDDGKTGCSDIIIHPGNPNVIYAAFYQRLREPDWFTSGGPNGGIFMSKDGGKSWTKLTNGLPTGETGNIDLSIQLANPKILVAAVEADENLPAGVPGTGVYRSDDGGKSWKYLLKHAVRPFYHGQIEIDPVDANNIYVVGRDFRISNDGGKTFHERDWNTQGGDDHDLWIAPNDNKIMYMATDQGLRLTIDGGKSFLSFNNMAIGQYYAIGVDMRDPYWVIGGLQDNALWIGPSNSREYRGILNMHNTWLGEGDGFHAQIDPTDYRTAYLVNHVGFAAKVNIETREYQYITPTPETVVNFKDYFDPDFPDGRIRYTIDPGEHWFFYERKDRPTLPPQFRFNWNSPLVLSPHNPNTLYFGGNYLFKTVDQGNSWHIISPDLTSNDPERRDPTNSGGLTRSVTGGENHYTIMTIAESPLDDQEIWVGTDDGHVQLTRDGGATWSDAATRIPGLPDRSWISRVEPSHHQAGTCYVTVDNHRNDDMQPYVYRTRDFGKTWENLSAGLPDNYSVYSLCEDPVNENLLFVGTEQAVHVSLDGGAHWQELMAGMPTVAMYDLLIHPRDGDLIAGTHGRSIWILDDLSPLRQMTPEIQEEDFHLFQSRRGTLWDRINLGRKQPDFEFRGKNPERGVYIDFWQKASDPDSVSITVQEAFGTRQKIIKKPSHQGLNRVIWYYQMDFQPEAITAYKAGLEKNLQDLNRLVANTQLKDTLNQLEERLEASTRLRALHSIRLDMIRQFSGYAGGQAFFEPKLMTQEAAPGYYKITVKLGTREQSMVVEVRDDPMNPK